ncbi:MAG TPA: autotransporter domain-containing protein, partial [Gammaproteobacteria bacterium]|nr:autotransporter domain-containing protein [Gammaproteobacteria bacterium]
IASGGSLSIGQTSTGVVSANSFSTGNSIVVTAVNVYNTSSLSTTGAGSVNANLYMLGTSTFSGSNITGEQLTIGIDSFGTQFVGTAFSASQNMINIFPTINVNTGSFNNNGNSIVATSLNMYNSTTLTSSGLGITANLYVTGSSTFSGTGINGSILTTGADSFGSVFSGTTFAAPQAISTFPSISVNAGTFTTAGQAISAVNTGFTILNGATATFDQVVNGTGTLTNGGMLNVTATDGIGLSGLITNTGTISFQQNQTITTSVNNSGAIAVSGGMTLSSSSSMFLFNNASLSGSVDGNGTGSLNFGVDSFSNPYPSTNATVSSNITNMPTVSFANGSGTTTGTISGVTSFTVAALATANIGGDITGTASATNAGTLNLSADLGVSSFTNLGTTNFIITNATVNGSITASGAVDLGSTASTVSSNFIDAVGGNNYFWTLVTAASITPNPAAFNIPNDTVANIWSIFQDATTVVFELEKLTLHVTVPVIGPVIDAMSDNPTTQGEFVLTNALGNALNQSQLDYYVTQLVPDLNSSSINVMKQDAIFTQVQNRMYSVRERVAQNSPIGFAAGEVGPNRALWLGGFVSFASQEQFGTNYGYRAYSGGLILGLDWECNDDNLLGVATARSSTNVQTKLTPGLNTRTVGYHVLFYGNHALSRRSTMFAEWMVSGASDTNTGGKRIYIDGIDMSTSASYHDYQGGFLFNLGNRLNCGRSFSFTQITSVQYNFIHTPPYYENGNTVAALYVQNNKLRNLLTVEAGARAAFNANNKFFKGRTTINAMIGYDVISSNQVTTASFLVGGGPFTYVNSPGRVSFSVGAECVFNMNEHTDVQLYYELQLRDGYIANAGTAKLRWWIW